MIGKRLVFIREHVKPKENDMNSASDIYAGDKVGLQAFCDYVAHLVDVSDDYWTYEKGDFLGIMYEENWIVRQYVADHAESYIGLGPLSDEEIDTRLGGALAIDSNVTTQAKV